MESFIDTISQQVGASVPNIIGAVLVLIVGWLLAVILAWLTQALLSRTDLDNRLARLITGHTDPGAEANIEKWLATAVFWIVMTFVLVGFLQALQLSAVSEPLNDLLRQIFSFLPNIGGALLLLALAWLLATVCRLLLVRGLKAFSLDDRLNAQMQGDDPSTSPPPLILSETLGNALYWFIFLLFIPGILDALQLRGPLGPIQSLLDEILSILPNILAAVVIGALGWFVARIVRMIVTNLLMATGADQVGANFGIRRGSNGRGLSWLAGTVAYVLLLIPFAIAALNALEVAAISAPAIEMLGQILNSLPKIFTAVVILGVGYFLGKFVSDLLTSILASIGFNDVFIWLGVQAEAEPEVAAPAVTSAAELPRPDEMPATPSAPSSAPSLSAKTPSEVAGAIALVGILLVFLIPATDVLEFEPLTNVVSGLLVILGQVLVGVLVFAVGLYLANLAFKLISSSGGSQARLVGQAARIAIIALVSAMALQQMGIATNIVNLAFGLLFGSIAVAIAVAFGFGSMDVAGEQVRRWLEDFRQQKEA